MGFYSRGIFPLYPIFLLTKISNQFIYLVSQKNLTERDKMTKTKRITLNAQKRKLALKVFNDHLQTESEADNPLKADYLKAKKQCDVHIENAFKTATEVVQRQYPLDTVKTLKEIQTKYNLNVCRPDSCFNFESDKKITKEDWNGKKSTVPITKHIDFNLNGNLKGNSQYDDKSSEFAFAYHHNHLRNLGLTPEAFVLKADKDDNPHHTKLIDSNNEALGIVRYGTSKSGIAEKWNRKYSLSVISQHSGCSTRFIQCTQDELDIMEDMLIAKQKVVQTYTAWQSNILERKNLIEQTLKSYKYFDEIKKLADNQKIDINENDIEAHDNKLSIYNPDNVSAMLDDLKPKAKETRAEKIARITALQNGIANA